MVQFRQLLGSSVVALGVLTLVAVGGCEGPICSESVTMLSSSDDEVSELLALVVGEHRLTMNYEEEHYSPIEIDPPAESTELVLTMSYAGGEARFVDETQERVEYEQNDEILCASDVLEVDAVARLRSADGLLDEELEVTLLREYWEDGTREEQVRFYRFGVAPDDLQGSATVVNVDPEDQGTISLDFRAEFDERSIDGTWGGGVTREDSGSSGTLASFWAER
jgi:hypothetical protein